MAGRLSLTAVFKAVDRFSGPMRRIEVRSRVMTRALKSGLSSANAATGALVAGLRRVTVVAGLAGAAVGGVAKHVIGVGADFEQGITNVAAVMGATRGAIADLEAEALRLGKTTKFTGTEVAAGMELMARAGFRSEDILAGIGGVLDAAASSGSEMAEVAGVVSNVLKGMGLAAGDTVRVADVLTKASQSTNSTLTSLGESMRNVAPVARQLGVSFEETVAAVALLQDVGMDASQAGTATATMLTKLTKPTATVKRQLRQLGVAFQDSKGDMLPFGEVLANMAKAAEKSGGNMKQVALFAELVGLRGQKAALNLQKLAKEGRLEELVTGLENAAGTAKRVAETRMDTFRGSVTKLGSAVDGLETRLFKAEGGPLRGVVDGMTAWVGKNEELIAQRVGEWVQKFKDNLPEIVTWTKRIAVGVATLYALHIATAIASGAVTVFEGVMTVCSGVVRVFGGAVRLARAALLSETAATVGSTIATGAKTVATKLMAAALALGRLATTQITAATIASSSASVANAVAEKARAVAHGISNVAVKVGRTVVVLFTAATKASTYASIANAVAEKAKALALGVSKGAMAIAAAASGVYAIATGQATVATTAFNTSAAALAVTLGAIAAAVGAVALAFDQYQKMKKEFGGDLVAVASKIASGQGLFQAVDNTMNEQARARAAQGASAAVASAPPPSADYGIRAAPEPAQAEITVKVEGGNAEVTQAPKQGTGSVRVQRSGGF